MRFRLVPLLVALTLATTVSPVTPAAASTLRPLDPSCVYILDGFGGVHCSQGYSTPDISAYWPNWDIARGMAIFPDGLGGYVADGFGGLHPLGPTAPATGFGYWPNWDIVRGIALAPWSTESAPQGYTLDGFGGVHPFGGAPGVGPTAYWPGWDIARGLVILPNSTPTHLGGYTLDGFGGIHPFGTAPAVGQPAFWPGWDIAKAIALTPDATDQAPSGLMLDGFGGLHAFGSAATVTGSQLGGYWPGWDIARDFVFAQGITKSNPSGWVVDGYGGVHAFGGAPGIATHAYWPGWDIVRGFSGRGSGSTVKPPPPPPPPTPAPVRLRIPKLGVDAEIDPVGFASDGSMQVPPVVGNVGWEQNWVAPGGPGNALLDGHLDWYNGPSVFYYLSTLNRDDEVFVLRADGSTVRFLVDSQQSYPWTASIADLYSNSGPAQVSLITCTGYWDGTRYTTRLVVRASVR